MAAQSPTASKKVASEKKTTAKSASKAATAKKSAATSKRTAKNTPQTEKTGGRISLRREMTGLLILAIALGILLALLSFHPTDITEPGETRNLIGPAGAFIGDALLYIFGLGAFFFNLVMWYLGFALLIGRAVDTKASEVSGQLLFVLAGAMLSHLVLNNFLILGHLPGGIVGEFSAEIFRSFVGTVGTYIIATSILAVSLMLATDMSLGAIVRAIIAQSHRLLAYIRHQLAVRREFKVRFAEERDRLLDEQGELIDVEYEARQAARISVAPLTATSYDFEEDFDEVVDQKVASRLARLFGRAPSNRSSDTSANQTASRRAAAKAAIEQAEADASAELDATPVTAKKSSKADAPKISGVQKVRHEVAEDQWEIGQPLHTLDELEQQNEALTIVARHNDDAIEISDTDVVDMRQERAPTSGISGGAADFGPQIVESEATRRARDREAMLADDSQNALIFKPQKRGNFELPSLSFLNYDKSDHVVVDTELLRQMAAQIEKTLGDFKVQGTVVEICPGPVITMFEFSPAPGVKISRIAGLADDLAMALSALSVRIIAPLPGKGVVGIEVPNPEREMVYLKEIIADEAFQDNTKMYLPLALGKDTEGGPMIADLARMPHLLVAGATGAGKSVAVNTMICSLLYKHSPDDVRMIMVDPKMLEFSIYADIPHLLLPVVTDPKQATVALNWTVQEMERRYQRLADMGVRDVRGYNQKVEILTKQAELDQVQGREESDALRALGIDAQGNPEHIKLPYIIVIIDEFADLMMTASKDVETAVARLAQKARAAGIHLILATQRPSTDVITGLIKANFPTRLALRVTSKIDSRVILDTNGAEGLLGNGDMLFVPPGSSTLARTHGAYVSEKEIDQIVDFLKSQGAPQYNDSILIEEDDQEENIIDESDKDEHYEEAVRIVVSTQQASISMLQRKLRVGYNRAARMVEVMEREGIVGPSDSCKPREVLVDISPY